MEYILCLALLCVGLYAVLSKRNLFKVIIGIAIIGYAINLLFILIGYRNGGEIPILERAGTNEIMVDPLAQAMVLTTIITGLSITVLLAALAARLFEKHRTFDLNEIKRLKG
jgi:multisubunit Na+/H+ antiporter MnhC subunit